MENLKIYRCVNPRLIILFCETFLSSPSIARISLLLSKGRNKREKRMNECDGGEITALK